MKIATIIVLLASGVIGFTQLIWNQNQIAAAKPSFHIPEIRPAQTNPVGPVPQRLFYQQSPLIAATTGKFV